MQRLGETLWIMAEAVESVVECALNPEYVTREIIVMFHPICLFIHPHRPPST